MSAIYRLDDAIKDTDNIKKTLQPDFRRKQGNVTREQRKETKLVTKDVTAGNAQYTHGPGGLFNYAGVDADVYNYVQRPIGLSARIPMRATRDWSPLFEAVISAASATGSEPADTCTRAKIVGQMKVAYLTAKFGLQQLSTETITMNKVGRLVNRADPLDLRLVNPNYTDGSPWIPDPARNIQYLTSDLGRQFYQVGLEYERIMEAQVFAGNGSGTADPAGNGQFYGLDTLINTGKTDAVDGVAISTLDSTIVAWSAAYNATQLVNGVSMDIVKLLSSLLRFKEEDARRKQLFPVSYGFAMRWELFDLLTAIWPCSYLTNGCSNITNGQIVLNDTENVRMRDDMRSNTYLLINGIQYPVIITDGNTESLSAIGSSSDIYLIPFVAAGRASLYFEYFDLQNAMVNEVRNMMPAEDYRTMNQGLYASTYNRTNFCDYFQFMTIPRLILRAPSLAARVTGVQYKAAFHTFDGIPTNGLYPQANVGTNVGQYNPVLYPYAV